MKIPKYGRDITFLLIESTTTSFILFMPVAYLLFRDIGLSQFQIGLTQFVFAITLLFLEVPTGYFADRVSRKISNAGGDIFLAFAILIYFFAVNFWHVVAAEVLFGIGLSLSNGADSALLRAHCAEKKLPYQQIASRLQSFGFVANGLGAIVGAYIGSHNLRWPFLLQAVVFLVAALFAFRIRNLGEHRKTSLHPVKDAYRIAKYCLHGHPKLAWRMLLGACLMGSTMMMVWFMSPSFIRAGIDIKYHGLLFAAVSIIAIFGSEAVVLNAKLKHTTPFLIAASAYILLGWKISLYTIFFFLLTSFARGVNTARTKPFIQEITPDDIQATAISVYGMLYRLASSCLVLLVNFVGNNNIQHGLMLSGIICVAMWAIFASKQRSFE